MGRGLGKIQLALLQYFAEMPEGGGKYEDHYWGGSGDLLRRFKAKQWPKIYGLEKPHFFRIKENYKDAPPIHGLFGIRHTYTYETRIVGYSSNKITHQEHKRELNRIRVTINASIWSLVKRGYLRAVYEYDEKYEKDYPKEIYITDEGRELIINGFKSNIINK